ncbi:MAG: heavy metal-binding domain-containing protein [Acidobacteriota bacterium]
MKRWFLLGLVALSLALFVACGGSENAEMEDQMHGEMCWNVIADEAGKCPKCGMILEKVSIDEAVANLKENGFSVQ